MRAILVTLGLVLLMAVPGVAGQATETPPLTAGPNKAYCHVTDATNTIWMNALQDDGDGVPYEIFGEPAFTDPVLGVGQDPVNDEAFEVRIPLSPVLAQDIVIQGTVNAQAFIGSGAYGGGTASIATSLVAGGSEIGAAAAKDHEMTPKNNNAPQLGTTYDEITWTFDVPETSIPAGTTLEWVIKGSATGNNIFLACHAARGRSNIELPIASAAEGAGTVVEHLLNGTAAKITLSAAEPTNATHVYSWTTNLTTLHLDIQGGVTSGNVTIFIVDGANATVHNATYAGNVSQEVTTAAGNWTFTVTLESFTGNLTIEAGPPTPVTPVSQSTTGTRPATSTTSSTQQAVNGTAKDDEGAKDTPATALPALVAAVAAAAVLARRRLP